jgi:hypothetical protein
VRGDEDVVTRTVLAVVALAFAYTYTLAPGRQRHTPAFALMRRVDLPLWLYGIVMFVAFALLAFGNPLMRMIGHLCGALTMSTLTLILAVQWRPSGAANLAGIAFFGGFAAWYWQSAYRVSFVDHKEDRGGTGS